jgi:ribosomal protein L11 methyltransferase
MRALSVKIEAGAADDATTALWEEGTSGIEVRPADPQGRVELLAYFPDSAPGGEPARLRTRLPLAAIETVGVPDVDWVARFREGFRSFAAGRFRIVPAWEAQAGSPAEPERLIVDPGRAFGTGTHETTRLCLAALEDLAGHGPLGRMLDLGAGTGLLAIAAARLGASPVVASDIDPDATASARLHARLNRVPLHVIRADGGRGLRWGCCDLVVANLMALLIVERAREIQALLAPHGALVLSGLLVEDLAPVRTAFAACGIPSERRSGEWAALVYESVP